MHFTFDFVIWSYKVCVCITFQVHLKQLLLNFATKQRYFIYYGGKLNRCKIDISSSNVLGPLS